MPSIVDYLAGYTNQGTMRDFQHASRLYLDNAYALAPKTSWIYYVVFSIEPSAISEVMWKNQRRDYEAGMLVKSCDLPKFQISVDTLNQYNRKTNVQSKITYQPISFQFHDDQSNVTNSLWVNYFRYYYRDTWHGQKVGVTDEITNKPAAFKNNKYEPVEAYPGGPDGRPGTPGAYGLNNNQSKPFFNAITIYQLNQKRFTSYIIVNPLITAWEHDQLDQTQGSKFATNKMTIAYETVFYGEGKVRRDQPSGFATFHYDVTPSPLSIAGGGTNTLFGPGGIISGVEDIFGSSDRLLNKGMGDTVLGTIGLGIKGANLLKNARNITRESLKAEGKSIINSALQGAISGAGGGFTGMINGGLGSLGSSLGFGPKTGTLLVGSNFKPNQPTAEPGDVVKISSDPGPLTATQQLDQLRYAEALVRNNTYSEESIAKLSNEDLPDAIAGLESSLARVQQQEIDQAPLDKEFLSKFRASSAKGGLDAADQVYKEYTAKGYETPWNRADNARALQDNINRLRVEIESRGNQ